MSRYKAVLFDCDGVLLDTELMGCRALHQAILNAGVTIDYRSVVKCFSGNAAQGCIEEITALGLELPVFHEADRLLFEMFAQDVPLIPAVETVLARLNVAAAVCSNSHIKRLDLSLGRTKLAPYFKGHIYSAEMVAEGKPSPAMIHLACERLGVAPHDAVFIDDNVQGIEAGRAAGCLTFGFCGPNEHRVDQADRLRAAGAAGVAHGMDEFGTTLAELGLLSLETVS